ncbi:MAG TPA: DUF5131 family protein [Phycisphaerae bacterium]|nr:DUF5131 family protein [Phycisphaerae bacterium]
MSLTKTKIPYLTHTWGVCGWGCSKKCDGCWACQYALTRGQNMKCPKCRAFEPHWHRDKMPDPCRHKAAVIGVAFYADLFDEARNYQDIRCVFRTAAGAPQHNYVFLTQQFKRCADALDLWSCEEDPTPNWHIGLTVHNQPDVERARDAFRGSLWPVWLSYEPAHGPVYILADFPNLSGIVVGCDNRPGMMWTDTWANIVVRQVKGRAPIFIKQIRNARGTLLTNPADFPESLRLRELPWGEQLCRQTPPPMEPK